MTVIQRGYRPDYVLPVDDAIIVVDGDVVWNATDAALLMPDILVRGVSFYPCYYFPEL